MPNGQLLEGQAITSCSFVFETADPRLPVAALPVRENSSVVHFCPEFFRKPESGQSLWRTDFRFLFCVAANAELYVHESTTPTPLYLLTEMHYASLTDICWFDQGRYLAVSSRDGYVTFVQVDQEHLQQPVGLEGGLTRAARSNAAEAGSEAGGNRTERQSCCLDHCIPRREASGCAEWELTVREE